MAIKAILWDIDGTVINFKAAEKNAIRSCFEVFGLGACSDEMIAEYSRINDRHWKMLERGELTKPEAMRRRLEVFFAPYGIPFDVIDDFNLEYQVRLGDTIIFNDDAYELISSLKGTVIQCAVTNGSKVAQSRKLNRSGLDRLFDYIFISDDLGIEKPKPGFFDRVFETLPAKREETMIVGDSLTSDVKGGNNAGIICCWYNPLMVENTAGVRVDYEIRDLREIKNIL